MVLVGMTAMSVQASYWHDLTDNERNQLILSEAQSWVDKYSGQSCKVWVQNLVWTASWETVWLPLNYYNPDNTYHLARWEPENSDVSVVLCSTLLISDYWWMFKPGQIIQMRHSAGGTTPHTMIIKSATYYGFIVIDSNWASDGYVREHWISGSWFASYVEAWTVYQIK